MYRLEPTSYLWFRVTAACLLLGQLPARADTTVFDKRVPFAPAQFNQEVSNGQRLLEEIGGRPGG